jgi:hypothetical protein
MLPQAFFTILLAVSTMAMPAPVPADFKNGHGELHVFKRDAILEARDFELAELHGVNLTESKHPMPQARQRSSTNIL